VAVVSTHLHKNNTQNNTMEQYNTYITIKIHKHTIIIHKRNNKDTQITESNSNTTISK